MFVIYHLVRIINETINKNLEETFSFLDIKENGVLHNLHVFVLTYLMRF